MSKEFAVGAKEQFILLVLFIYITIWQNYPLSEWINS